MACAGAALEALKPTAIWPNSAPGDTVEFEESDTTGFSAGAHLAAHLSNQYAKKTYESLDEADAADCRPYFVALIYPGLLTEGNAGTKLAPEMTVTADTPPTFLLQSEDDGVKVENSLLDYVALKAAKVPAEMHLFAKGGHSYGLQHTGMPVKLAERVVSDPGRNARAVNHRHERPN